MADKRKLQGEIERCLKKVNEGVDAFEDIWGKVMNAPNANQKEKYEADLKKEIKKLQRLRDQIKNWQSSTEIKDKGSLAEARRLIEQQMERFKVIEKETKTKAYSKEGLGLANKVDPATKEKEECREWLNDTIDLMKQKAESVESEIEALPCVTRSTRKDKKDRHADHIEQLQESMGKLHFHIKALETILRKIDNESLEVDQVNQLRDTLEAYVDGRETGFQDDESFYDHLSLDLDSPTETSTTTKSFPELNAEDEVLSSSPGLSSSSAPSATKVTTPRKPTKSVMINGVSSTVKSSRSSSLPSCSAPSAITTTATMVISKPPGPIVLDHAWVMETEITKQRSTVLNGLPASSAPTKNLFTMTTTASASSASAASVVSHPPSKSPPLSAGYAAVAGNSQNTKPTKPVACKQIDAGFSVELPKLESGPLSTSLPTNSISAASAHQPSTRTLEDSRSEESRSSSVSSVSFSSMANQASENRTSSDSDDSSHTEAAVILLASSSTTAESSGPAAPAGSAHPVTASSVPPELASPALTEPSGFPVDVPPCVQSSPSGNARSESSESGPTDDVHSSQEEHRRPPPITQQTFVRQVLGVVPLGIQPLDEEHRRQLDMLEYAAQNMPTKSDLERLRPQISKVPMSTPPLHLHSHNHQMENQDFFEKLPAETLFFTFYYQQGTRAQHLAAKALKAKAWRYHTKFMMWFQRHEEPKVITDDYEQGTYIYFDFEKWLQKKKESFMFEYKFLEDKDFS